MRSALFDHLLATSLYAAVVAGMVWAALGLFRRAAPRWRLTLWSLVMLRLLLPAGWSQPLSARTALDGLRRLLTGPATVMPFAEPDFTPLATADAHRTDTGPRLGTSRLQIALLIFWLLGGALFTGLYISRLRRYRQTARLASMVQDRAVLELAQRWRSRFAIRRPVKLVTGGTSPFTVGILRPRIVLPPRLLEPGRRRTLEPVIAHEMAHIRRFDAVWLAWQNLLQAAYFFHPAIWIAGHQINAARESVCDDMVLARGAIPVAQYGRGLLAVLRDHSPDLYSAVSGMSPTARQLKTRLKNLQGDHTMKKSRTLIPLFTTIALVFLLLPMAARPHDDQTPAPVSRQAPVAQPNPVTVAGNPATTTPAKPILKFPLLKPGYWVSGFGWRINPITRKKEHHDGCDLAVYAGSKVVASGAGTVAEVTTDRSAQRGMTLTIDHGNGWQTYYAFLDELSVVPDQAVNQGDVIGKIGKVGVSTGPHLHFQVMKDGKPVDPKDELAD